MATARAGTKDEALRLLDTSGITAVELDYETGWQDAVELGRRGQRVGSVLSFEVTKASPFNRSLPLLLDWHAPR